MDRNCNGMIDVSQLKDLMTSLAEETVEDRVVERVWAKLDVGGNGSIMLDDVR